MPSYSHLKNHTPLSYAELHLDKSSVNLIKHHIKKCPYYKQTNRGWAFACWISAKDLNDGVEWAEKQLTEYFNRYNEYKGDKRDSMGRLLRQQWIEAKVDLLYSQFKVCWFYQQNEGTKYESKICY
jgi:hypothetical protein